MYVSLTLRVGDVEAEITWGTWNNLPRLATGMLTRLAAAPTIPTVGIDAFVDPILVDSQSQDSTSN